MSMFVMVTLVECAMKECLLGQFTPSQSNIIFLPELRLPPRDTIDEEIVCLPKSKSNRAAVLVALVAVLIIPLLPVPEEKCLSMASDRDGVSANSESGAAPCIRNTDAV